MMISFEALYLIFGMFVISAGVALVVTYSRAYPWWKEHLGRMLVTYAVAEVLMSILLTSAVVWHFSPHWFRGVWFALQAVVGYTFWFQTVTIRRLRRAKLHRGDEFTAHRFDEHMRKHLEETENGQTP